MAEKRAQEIALYEQIGNRAKSMHPWIQSSTLDGSDVYAACKRAMILSQDPATVNDEVERWMVYIVEAVESDNFDVSVPAWEWFAENGVLDEGHAFWLLQLAHSLGALRSTIPLIRAYPRLAELIDGVANAIAKDSALGSYSINMRRIKEPDLRRLLSSAESSRGYSGCSKSSANQAVPLSVMLRARRMGPDHNGPI
jgi:hypothetical protein